MKKKKLILIILFSLFIIDFILIIFNKSKQIDNCIYNLVAFNKNDSMISVMKSLTFLGSTPFIVGSAFVGFIVFFLFKKCYKGLLEAVLLINSTIVNNVIKIIIRRPRPLNMLVVENTFSFPSGHIMGSTTFYGFLIYYIINTNIKKSYKIILITILSLFILTVGITRIYLRAHFFTDVFAGYLISSILILIYDMYLEPKLNIIKK